jgi:ketosteroid isomerase-like protein
LPARSTRYAGRDREQGTNDSIEAFIAHQGRGRHRRSEDEAGPGVRSAGPILRSPEEEVDMTALSPLQVIERMYGAFDDPEAMMALWHPDVSYFGMDHVGDDRLFEGLEQFGALYVATAAVMDVMSDELDRAEPVGEDLVMAHARATRRGAATGETITSSYVIVLQVVDGAIVRGVDKVAEDYRAFFRRQAAATDRE